MIRGRLCSLVIAAFVVLETAAGQNAVTDWNNIAITAALAANQTTSPGSNTQPGSMLYLAYVHLAVFDAVNAIDHRYQSYGPDISASNTASKEAATIEAAYRMCLYLFPDQAGALSGQYTTSMAAIPDGTDKTDGMQAGLAAANSIVALRTGDGRGANVLYTWPPVPTAGAYGFRHLLLVMRQRSVGSATTRLPYDEQLRRSSGQAPRRSWTARNGRAPTTKPKTWGLSIVR